MSAFETPAPRKAVRDDGQSVTPFTGPHTAVPNVPANDVRHVPIPTPARTAGDKR